jgi:hypothetical protein
MKPPADLSDVICRKRYSTATATLLIGNDYWDGHNYERSGRNTFLYRTPKGAYFAVYLTRWEGERNRIEALTVDAAMDLYESLTECRVPMEDAFPGLTIENA